MTHTLRSLITILIILLATPRTEAGDGHSLVADSLTRTSLPGATVFDRHGKAVGVCDTDGRTPYIDENRYPLTVRYLGYREKRVAAPTDTIFLRERHLQLPEVVVESRKRTVLHILAYVREYSTLTTYSDTVFLFREKTVDYMLPSDNKGKFKGWSSPRILKCKSYYRFTDNMGTDSVSDESNYHFSWSDWVGVRPALSLPTSLRGTESARDTLRGKYSPAELWTRNGDRVTVDVDVLADTTSRKWVPKLAGFFRDGLEFENFKLRYSFDNVTGNLVRPIDLNAYSFSIESDGRGHDMFRFNRHDEAFFVSTYAEAYILDKKYLSVKEAKQWDRRLTDFDAAIGIYSTRDVPELQPSIRELIARVENIDKGAFRTTLTPDLRLAWNLGRKKKQEHIGQRLLRMLKVATGISRYKMNRNLNRGWNEFRTDWIHRNDKQEEEEK